MPVSPASTRDLPHGCMGHGLSPRAERGDAASEPKLERSACGMFGSLGRWKGLFGKQQGQQRCSPPSGTMGSRRSFGPCGGCTEGTLTIKRGAWVHARALEQEAFGATGICFSQSRAPSGELTKRSGQALICTCRSRAVCASLGQENTGATQDQSKAWPELLLSWTAAPRAQTTTTCSKAKPWAGGRAGPGLCCLYLPIPTSHLHTRPPPRLVQAHPASPSPQSKPRLQRHSTLQPARTTLGLMTDTTHSRNTALGTRVSHPSPQATSSTSPGWQAQRCTHSLDR